MTLEERVTELEEDKRRLVDVIAELREAQRQTATEAVREFHEKHGFVNGTALAAFDSNDANAEALRMAGAIIDALAQRWRTGEHDGNGYDDRLMRGHLMMEELAESLNAMADGDEAALLDGLADLKYVTHGTAVAFDLPLEEAFEEVHASNMTKNVGGGPRLSDKGQDYRPPNLLAVLEKHRESSG